MGCFTVALIRFVPLAAARAAAVLLCSAILASCADHSDEREPLIKQGATPPEVAEPHVGAAAVPEPAADASPLPSVKTNRKIDYLCAAGERFSVFYGVYDHQGRRVELEPDTVILSDAHSHTTYKLLLQPTASGAKYANTVLSYWSKGDAAMLHSLGAQGEFELYQDCKQYRAEP